MKKYNHWQIAYRTEKNREFKLLANPSFAWAADPFLVKFQEEIYLFAELYLYKSERNGVIGYCVYKDGEFGEWKVTMDRHWHLSYPNVFVYKNELYMCPESYQREDISVYKLKKFPNKWEKVHTFIENEKCVDTTFLEFNNNIFILTFKPNFQKYGGQLYLFKVENGQITERQYITDNKEYARPGGKILNIGGKCIRVSQDCSNGYGCGLVFSEIINAWPKYDERIVKRITVNDIPISEKKRFTGIHTYNLLDGIEVVDLKYSSFSLQEYVAQKRVKRVFVNKY